VARIVLGSVQELLLKLALQMDHDDYETRRERLGVQLAKRLEKLPAAFPTAPLHQRIVALRATGQTIKRTAELSGCSRSQVKRIWAIHRAQSEAS
jgi:DNA invertase Pin-like site-specific DNA recombinase